MLFQLKLVFMLSLKYQDLHEDIIEVAKKCIWYLSKYGRDCQSCMYWRVVVFKFLSLDANERRLYYMAPDSPFLDEPENWRIIDRNW